MKEQSQRSKFEEWAKAQTRPLPLDIKRFINVETDDVEYSSFITELSWIYWNKNQIKQRNKLTNTQ